MGGSKEAPRFQGLISGLEKLHHDERGGTFFLSPKVLGLIGLCVGLYGPFEWYNGYDENLLRAEARIPPVIFSSKTVPQIETALQLRQKAVHNLAISYSSNLNPIENRAIRGSYMNLGGGLLCLVAITLWGLGWEQRHNQ